MSNKTPPVEPLDDSALDGVQGGTTSVATRTGNKLAERPTGLKRGGVGTGSDKIVTSGGGSDI